MEYKPQFVNKRGETALQFTHCRNQELIPNKHSTVAEEQAKIADYPVIMDWAANSPGESEKCGWLYGCTGNTTIAPVVSNPYQCRPIFEERMTRFRLFN